MSKKGDKILSKKKIVEKNNNPKAKSLIYSRMIVAGIKGFVLFVGVIGIIIVILGLIDIKNVHFDPGIYDSISNKYIQFIIFIVLNGARIVLVYLTLDEIEKTISNMISVSIFCKANVHSLNKCLTYLIFIWILEIFYNLNIFAPLLAIAAVGLIRNIFIYGNSLEEEMNEVI